MNGCLDVHGAPWEALQRALVGWEDGERKRSVDGGPFGATEERRAASGGGIRWCEADGACVRRLPLEALVGAACCAAVSERVVVPSGAPRGG